MKSMIIGLVAGSALAGCTVSSGAAPYNAAVYMPKKGAPNGPEFLTRPRGYASAVIEEDKYEVTYSGPWLGSMDDLEGGLLYRAALLAKERGRSSFRFLPMLGETGPLLHPRRLSPSFGAAYGHWQPHWSYRTEAGWQPWHPEWGDRFWADRLAKGTVKWVEVHAMVELRRAASGAEEQMDFEVAAVLRDLRRFGQ